MTAVSLSVVGNATKNPTLSIEGSKKYGQALWELQKALWDKRLMYEDGTLAACNALILYEVCLLLNERVPLTYDHYQAPGVYRQ